MKRFSKQPFLLASLCAVPVLLAASLAQAGNQNLLYVVQESPATGPGNMLTVDQSDADSSAVVGPSDNLLDLHRAQRAVSTIANSLRVSDVVRQVRSTANPDIDRLNPAQQTGGGNVADITIAGSNSEFQLYQHGRAIADNRATVDISGNNALGAVLQSGSNNSADLTMTGGSGLISQTGNNNEARLTVGMGADGEIIQTGNDNEVLNMTVSPGASVSYSQIGDNQTANAATLQVFTANPGTVTITQTSY